jgi:hypothetical protein
MERSDKENSNNLKRLRSQSPEIGGETSKAIVTVAKRCVILPPPFKDIPYFNLCCRPALIRRIPLSEIKNQLKNRDSPCLLAAAASDVPADAQPPSPIVQISQMTPIQPHRQTPAHLVVSQNYMRKLVAERWDAEVRRCEEGRKAQLLEVQLAAHGITKLV